MNDRALLYLIGRIQNLGGGTRNEHSLMRLVLEQSSVRERLSYGKVRLLRIPPPTSIYALSYTVSLQISQGCILA